jgi:hypothetical protein
MSTHISEQAAEGKTLYCLSTIIVQMNNEIVVLIITNVQDARKDLYATFLWNFVDKNMHGSIPFKEFYDIFSTFWDFPFHFGSVEVFFQRLWKS